MSAPAATGERTGVLLMTYGSPASLDDLPRYMTAVRGGRIPDDGLVNEFRRRYELIGGSPLIAITLAQAAALERRLGGEIPVRAGMRFSQPTIAHQLAELAHAGAAHVVAILMSPQFSELLMGGYTRAIDAGREALGAGAPDVRLAGAWHTEPKFIASVACRIGVALGHFEDAERDRVAVLMTAHSLPRRVAEREPRYLEQLEQTAQMVAAAAGLGEGDWRFCWQSAGHEPGEWMKPDFGDLMPTLASEGYKQVLVAPIQFLADHLEILYDVDIAARQQAESAGLRFARIESLNTDERFIDALAAVALRAAAAPAAAQA